VVSPENISDGPRDSWGRPPGLPNGQSDSGPVQLTGRTATDHIVVFDGNPRLIGQFVEADIEEATAFTLFGRVVTSEQVGVENSGTNATLQPDGRRLALPVL
jgi:tRNA-2-methylthio-N6-dimethylallyladenosine synthase